MNSVTDGENRQWRTLAARQGEYRQKLLEMLAERVRKPAATASLALVGTLVLIAVLGLGVLRPTLLTVSSLIKEIQDEQKLVKALDDKFRALVAVEGLLEEMKFELPRIDWAIPADQEFEVFAKEVEILAKEKGLAAVEISQAGFGINGKDGGGLAAWVAVGGSEEQVRNFLGDLIKMDRLVLLKSVNVSSVPKDGRQDEPYQVRGSATVEILYSAGNSENSDSGQSDGQTVKQSDDQVF